MQIIQFVLLAIGTLLTLGFIILSVKGGKYDALLEGLPDEGFGDKDLWAAGYALQENRALGIESAMGQRLLAQAKLLYPENECKYAEYWARLYWARTLSLSMMVAAVSLCICGLTDGVLMLVVLAFGGFATYAMFDAGANAMNTALKKRSEDCLQEFSNMVSKLALLVNTGMILHDAWFVVAGSKEGPLYDLMRTACSSMENGRSDIDALYDFGVQSNTPEIRKFAGILIQNMSKGGSDLTLFLTQQSSELWSRKRQMMLQKGDEAAAKLLLPTMLMLVGILIIIIVSAVAGLNLSL